MCSSSSPALTKVLKLLPAKLGGAPPSNCDLPGLPAYFLKDLGTPIRCPLVWSSSSGLGYWEDPAYGDKTAIPDQPKETRLKDSRSKERAQESSTPRQEQPTNVFHY